jgi:CRISPR-associated protein Cas8a1/Csx13
MAKPVKTHAKREAPELLVPLHAPGMTALLKAGAGGLASSLRSLLLREAPRSSWPAPVPLGPGSATVAPGSIRLAWGGKPPEQTLEVLFRESFRLRAPEGIIDLPGTYAPGGPPPALPVAVALQEALKLTFLQHGKTTTKEGTPQVHTFSLDEQELRLEFQRYSGFVHQEAWKEVAEALERGSTSLAGWAYPGAAERHIGLRVTKMEYTAAEALCACFALVGCLSFKVPLTRGGALVALTPTDLVRFAELRPRLTPVELGKVSVAGASDAVLALELALRMEARLRGERALGTAEAFSLRTLPWARQQKSRSGVLQAGGVPEAVLDAYDTAARELPSRLKVLAAPAPRGKAAGKPGPADFFVASSTLRAFLADNLASGRRWYEGFATATDDSGPKRRFLHYVRTQDNLGALFPEERKGLIAMLPHLEDAEQVLVESVHQALRQRFGAIADETRGNPVARKNRWNAERDRWRLAFAGAKTLEQVRATLADLWSRAGPNRALQERWRDVLPLLRSEYWRAARDLALVGLASYQGQGTGADEPPESEENAPSHEAE